MPSKYPPRKHDPFSRIKAWDDGYEYINQTPSPSSDRQAPFYSSPPTAPQPPRPAAYGYDEDRLRRPARGTDEPYRRAYPSPPSDDGDYGRRRPRKDASPPPYRSTRSPSPPRRRDARHPPAASYQRPRETAGAPLRRSKSMRDSAPQAYSRSPSPPRRRRHRSPSPILPGGRVRDPYRRASSPSPSSSISRSPSRDRNRRERKRNDTTPRYRSPSPASKPPRRPAIHRANTTSAAEKKTSGLSPRWQQAAAAAFSAGSAAAWKMRSQPGAWNGEKGAKVATAALGAAAMRTLTGDQKKEEENKKRSGGGRGGGRRNSGVEAMGGALGGFLADQLKKKDKKRY